MATDDAVVGADLEQARAALPERLRRRPIIDIIEPRTLALIRTRVNAASKVKVGDDELGAFLEMAAEYKLDPLNGEVWLVKSGTDKVLLMVGRDGLRKVAMNNGFRVVSDVVHASDDFRVVVRGGEHEVVQGYSNPASRGDVVGAWAQVFDRDDVERGFYMAPLEEWKPKNEKKLQYSPWGSQESVMILAAAERQALRQATPLSGLVAQGELDRGEEMAEGLPSREEEDERLNAVAVQFSPETCRAILSAVSDAREMGHAGLSDIGTLEMRLTGQPEDAAKQWLEEAAAEMREAWQGVEAEPPEAEVVPSEDTPESAEARAEQLRAEANGLLDEAGQIREKIAEEENIVDGTPNHLLGAWANQAEELEAEAEQKHDEAERLAPSEPSGQETLGGVE